MEFTTTQFLELSSARFKKYILSVDICQVFNGRNFSAEGVFDRAGAGQSCTNEALSATDGATYPG